MPRGGPVPTARSLRVRPSAARGPPHGPRPLAAAVRACAVPGSSGVTACLIARPDRRRDPTSQQARRVRWPAAGAKVTRCDLRAIAPSAGVLAVWPGFLVRFRPRTSIPRLTLPCRLLPPTWSECRPAPRAEAGAPSAPLQSWEQSDPGQGTQAGDRLNRKRAEELGCETQATQVSSLNQVGERSFQCGRADRAWG